MTSHSFRARSLQLKLRGWSHSSFYAFSLAWLSSLTIGLSACEGNEEPPRASGGSAGNAGSPGQGGSSGATQGEGGDGGLAGEKGDALLDRTPELGYDCVVETEPRLLGVPSSSFLTSSLVKQQDQTFLSWAETPDWTGADPAVRLQVARLGADAGLSSTTTVASETSVYFSQASLVPREAGLTLIAMRQAANSYQILLSELSPDGQVVSELKPVHSSSTVMSRLLIAQGESGIGMIWNERPTLDGNLEEIRFALLDATGTLRVSETPLASSTNYIWPGAIVASSQGFLVTYAENVWGDNASTQTLYSRAIAEDGSLGAVTALESSSFGDSSLQSLLWRGSEALLARSFTEGTYEGEQLGSTVLLTRLDAQGRRLGSDMRVSRWVRSQVNSDPFLFQHGEDIGLVWSQGSVIYICAGCMPDNHLEFVLFDGETFVPKSNRLQLQNPAEQGGLINPELVAHGDDFLLATRVGYHVTSELSAAALRCSAR